MRLTPCLLALSLLLVGCPTSDGADTDTYPDGMADSDTSVASSCDFTIISERGYDPPGDLSVGVDSAVIVDGDVWFGGWTQVRSGISPDTRDGFITRVNRAGEELFSVSFGDESHREESTVALLPRDDGVLAVIDRGDGSDGNAKTARLVLLNDAGASIREVFVPNIRPKGAIARSDGSLVILGALGGVVVLTADLEVTARRRLPEGAPDGAMLLAQIGDVPVVVYSVDRGDLSPFRPAEGRGVDLAVAGLTEDGRVSWEYELSGGCNDQAISLHSRGDEVVLLAMIDGAFIGGQPQRPSIIGLDADGVRWTRPFVWPEAGVEPDVAHVSVLQGGDMVLLASMAARPRPPLVRGPPRATFLDSMGDERGGVTLRSFEGVGADRLGVSLRMALQDGDEVVLISDSPWGPEPDVHTSITRMKLPTCAPTAPRNAPGIGPVCGQDVDAGATGYRSFCSGRTGYQGLGVRQDPGTITTDLCGGTHFAPQHLPEPWIPVTPAYRLDPPQTFSAPVGVGVLLPNLIFEPGWELFHDAADGAGFVARGTLDDSVYGMPPFAMVPSAGAFVVARNPQSTGLLSVVSERGATLVEGNCGVPDQLRGLPDGGLLGLCPKGQLWRSAGTDPFAFEFWGSLTSSRNNLIALAGDVVLAGLFRESLGGFLVQRVAAGVASEPQLLIDTGTFSFPTAEVTLRAAGTFAAALVRLSHRDLSTGGSLLRSYLFTSDDAGGTWQQQTIPDDIPQPNRLTISGNKRLHLITQQGSEKNYHQWVDGTLTEITLMATSQPVFPSVIGPILVSPNGMAVKVGLSNSYGAAAFTSMDGGATFDTPAFVSIASLQPFGRGHTFVNDDGSLIRVDVVGLPPGTLVWSDADMSAASVQVDGPYVGTPFSAVRTPDGTIWVSSPNGLARVDKPQPD